MATRLSVRRLPRMSGNLNAICCNGSWPAPCPGTCWRESGRPAPRSGSGSKRCASEGVAIEAQAGARLCWRVRWTCSIAKRTRRAVARRRGRHRDAGRALVGGIDQCRIVAGADRQRCIIVANRTPDRRARAAWSYVVVAVGGEPLSVARGSMAGWRGWAASLVAGVAVADALHGIGAGTVALVAQRHRRVRWRRPAQARRQPRGRRWRAWRAGACRGWHRTERAHADGGRTESTSRGATCRSNSDRHCRRATSSLPQCCAVAGVAGIRRCRVGAFLDRFAAHDALRGRGVVVHAHDGGHAGVVVGVAEDGALRVRFDDGERNVHAGEVSVRGWRRMADWLFDLGNSRLKYAPLRGWDQRCRRGGTWCGLRTRHSHRCRRR